MGPKSLRWVSAAFLIAVIVVTAFRPRFALPLALQDPGTHIFIHVFVYTLLAALLSVAFPGRLLRWIVFLAVALLGFGTEYYEQLFTRLPIEMDDVLLDVVGSAVGVISAAWFTAWCERREDFSD